MAKGLSITALVFGILAFLIGWVPIIGWLIWIAAIVIGIVAIVKSKEPGSGRGMAITGLVLPLVGLVIGIIFIVPIMSLAFFGVLNPARMIPDKCELAPGLTCMDFTAEDGEITILINNGLGMEMVDVTLYVDDCENDASATIDTFKEGSTEKLTIPCEGMISDERFKSDLSIDYNTIIEGNPIMHSKMGYLVVEVK